MKDVLVDGYIYSVVPVKNVQKFIDMGWEVVYQSNDDKVVIVAKKGTDNDNKAARLSSPGESNYPDKHRGHDERAGRRKRGR